MSVEVTKQTPSSVDPAGISTRPSAEVASREPKKVGLYRKFAAWLLGHQGTPHSLALGFAIGMFVALTPTVGFQMMIGATIAHFMKANRVIAAALAWITNPFTIVPIYYFNYRVGLLFLPGDEEAGLKFIQTISQAKLTDPETIGASLKLMAQELWGIAGVLWLGSVLVGLVVALVSYPLVKRVVEVEQRRLHQRLDDRGDRGGEA